MPLVEQIESRFVAPFYLHVLHGNLVAASESASRQDEIGRKMQAVAADVTFDVAVWSRAGKKHSSPRGGPAVWRWPGLVGQVEPLLNPKPVMIRRSGRTAWRWVQARSADARAVLMRYLNEYSEDAERLRLLAVIGNQGFPDNTRVGLA